MLTLNTTTRQSADSRGHTMMIPDFIPEQMAADSMAESLERIARALESLVELAESAAQDVSEEEG